MVTLIYPYPLYLLQKKFYANGFQFSETLEGRYELFKSQIVNCWRIKIDFKAATMTIGQKTNHQMAIWQKVI